MYRKFLSAEVGSISKQIKIQFKKVVNSMQVQLRQKGKSRMSQLQKLQTQLKKMVRKINTFSNLLLNDDFNFRHLEEEPLIMVKYLDIVLQLLIDNHSSDYSSQVKKFQSNQRNYNQNNIYETVAALKLQNYDLRDMILSLNKKLQTSNTRAIISEQIAENIKGKSQVMINSYKQNFSLICDLLKRTQNNQIQLCQNNRLLKQQIQSLSIQFQRYKQYFKQGPSLKQKQIKMKDKLERQYELKSNNIIKQIELQMRTKVDNMQREVKIHKKLMNN